MYVCMYVTSTVEHGQQGPKNMDLCENRTAGVETIGFRLLQPGEETHKSYDETIYLTNQNKPQGDSESLGSG